VVVFGSVYGKELDKIYGPIASDLVDGCFGNGRSSAKLCL